MDTTGDGLQSQVDRIVYLASLASDKNSIDPMLDTLRMITSKQQAGEASNEDDKARLTSLEGELKGFLINQDPLRSFTSESLEERLQDNDKHLTGPDKNKQTFWFVLIASFLTLATAFLLLPASLSLQSRAILAVPPYLTVITIGVTWFYLSSLKNFKPGLRRAFILLSCSWIMMSIVQLHYAVILQFDLLRYPLFKFAGLTIFVSLWMMFAYLGLRKYAGLLGLRNRLTSWKWIGGSVVALVLLVLLAPHPSSIPDEAFFRLAMACVVPTIPLGIFSSLLAFDIKRHVTPAYAKSMTILAWYLSIVTVNCIIGITMLFFIGVLSALVLAAIVSSGAIPQIISLYTGYLFKKNTSK